MSTRYFARVYRRAAIAAALALLVAAGSPNGAAAARFKPFKLKTLDGTQTSLSAVLGRVTLVVFFFPSCTFCRAALPEIQKIHDTYQGDGLAMVWINVVPEEDRLIAGWRGTHRITAPILLGGRSVQNDYHLTITPTHYLLDRQGNVLATHAGYQPGDEKVLERDIRIALGHAT